jgi:hypothetical protein
MDLQVNTLKYLLPGKTKYLGVIFAFFGIILLIIRYYFDQKLDIFDSSIFAIYSHFLKAKYFTVITNNLTEEVAFLITYLGLIFIAFSKNIIENQEINILRIESFFLAIYLNSAFLIITMFTFFGIGYIAILSINLVSFLLLFIIILYFKYFKYKHITKNS